MKTISLTYNEYLREDFVSCYVKIAYDKINYKIKEACINHYEFGVIEIINDKKTIHKWETEEQAHNDSYLTRRFTITLLNGIELKDEFEDRFLSKVMLHIKRSDLDNKTKNDFQYFLDKIANEY